MNSSVPSSSGGAPDSPSTLLTPSEGAEQNVVGLVDALLASCPPSGLRIEWRGEQCRVDLLDSQTEAVTIVALPRSAFRAMLTHIAALCHAHAADAVSPQGGQGELQNSSRTGRLFLATFVNTATEHRLELSPLTKE